ncbi:WD40 repeat domain-containing protein [Candidatus Dependentiae bacterium]
MKLTIKKSVSLTVLLATLFVTWLSVGMVEPVKKKKPELSGILASGSTDKTIKIWDIKTGKTIKTFKGHKGSIESMAFSPDGKNFASGFSDGIVKVWDTITWQNLQILKNHKGLIKSVAFSVDSLLLASGSSDKKIKIYENKGGKWKLIKQTLSMDEEVSSVAFGPKITNYIVAADRSAIKIWENISKTGWKYKNTQTFKIKNDGLFYGTVLSSDECIANISSSEVIEFFDKKSDSLWKKTESFKFKHGTIISLAFYPKDPNLLTVRTSDGFIILLEKKGAQWAAKSILGVVTPELRYATTVVFSPDGKYLAIALKDGRIQIFSIKTGKLIKSLQGHKKGVLCLAWHPKPKVTKKILKKEKKKMPWDIIIKFKE